MRPRRILPALLLALIALTVWIGALQLGADRVASAPSLPPSIVGQVIESLSPAELEAHVCHLQDKDALGYCNTQGTRFSWNAAGLQEAANYIDHQLQEHGVTVTTQTFTRTHIASDQDVGTVLTNVIGTLEGIAPPIDRGVVIVSAHYDSTASRTRGWTPETEPAPGADDNATGVAAVLEAARLLSGRCLRHTVRLAAFAGEEQGLHGSRHYAEQARATGENIIAVVNVDMIGYESDGEPRLEIHAGLDPRSITLAHTLTESVQAYHLDLSPQVVTQRATDLSDHSPFWKQGFPAILVIEDTDLVGPTNDFNPYYHTIEDTLDKINRGYFSEMARAAIGTVTRLAQPAGPDLRVVQQGPAMVRRGQTVTFTLAYGNNGTAPADNVVLTDTLSHGLVYQSDSSGAARAFDVGNQVMWELGDLVPGDSSGFVVTATVLAEAQSLTSVSGRTMIAGDGLDTDAADNVSRVEIPIHDLWKVYLPLSIMPLRGELRRRWGAGSVY